jgi:uncharacterized damage-inducible protein DinB
VSTPADGLTRSPVLYSALDHPGTIKGHYPFWDSYHRPYLVEGVRLLPPENFDYKPKPEMLTARQHILHIAETEAWWVHHMVDGEPFRDFTLRHADPAQGWTDGYEARDHNQLLFLLEEYHRPTQRWFGAPTQELSKVIHYRRKNGEEMQHSLHWILDHVLEHELHHRAQLFLYLRMLGITPPSV